MASCTHDSYNKRTCIKLTPMVECFKGFVFSKFYVTLLNRCKKNAWIKFFFSYISMRKKKSPLNISGINYLKVNANIYSVIRCELISSS